MKFSSDRIQRRRPALWLGIALLGFLAVGCEEAVPVTDITFSGSMVEAALGARQSAGGATLIDPTQFALYCVTFTDPAQSGNGTFDATGNFSVTITEAADLPVGCFIVDSTTGVAVATVTFIVGATGGFDDTSSTTALEGGTYDITINFDPEAGTATVDLTQIIAGSGATTTQDLDPTSIPGSWNGTCSTTNSTDDLAICQDFVQDGNPANTSLNIYFDVIGAMLSGQQVYAMGVWGSRADYIAAGATEGINSATLPPEVTNLQSYNQDVTLAADGVTPSAAGTFPGFMTTAGANYDTNTHTMTGAAVVATLDSLGLTYDGTANDQWLGVGDNDWCPNLGTAVAFSTLDLTNGDVRGCLLQTLDAFSNGSLDDGGSLIPRAANTAWRDFGWIYDDMGNPVTFDPAVHKIEFRTTQVADTPEIGTRFTLMDLEILGTTAVAREFREEQWNEWDEINNVSIVCDYAQELTITMVPNAAGTVFSTYFAVNEFNSCEGGGSYASFKMDFVKQ